MTRAILALLLGSACAAAHAQAKTDFDARARPARVALDCSVPFDERDERRAPVDRHGSLTGSLHDVGEWIKRGYSPTTLVREGDRFYKVYVRHFRVTVTADAEIELDADARAQYATVTHRWRKPRFDVSTSPTGMEQYATPGTRQRFMKRAEQIRADWVRQYQAIDQQLRSMRLHYDASELALIRGAHRGGFTKPVRLSLCDKLPGFAVDVRWRRYVSGDVGRSSP